MVASDQLNRNNTLTQASAVSPVTNQRSGVPIVNQSEAYTSLLVTLVMSVSLVIVQCPVHTSLICLGLTSPPK